MSYQTGFAGNDLAGWEAAIVAGRWGSRQDTTRELCCVILLFDCSECSFPVPYQSWQWAHFWRSAFTKTLSSHHKPGVHVPWFKEKKTQMLFLSKEETYIPHHFTVELSHSQPCILVLTSDLVNFKFCQYELKPLLCSSSRQRHRLFPIAASKDQAFFYIPTITSGPSAAITLTGWQTRVLPQAHRPMTRVHNILGSCDSQRRNR